MDFRPKSVFPKHQVPMSPHALQCTSTQSQRKREGFQIKTKQKRRKKEAGMVSKYYILKHH